MTVLPAVADFCEWVVTFIIILIKKNIFQSNKCLLSSLLEMFNIEFIRNSAQTASVTNDSFGSWNVFSQPTANNNWGGNPRNKT